MNPTLTDRVSLRKLRWGDHDGGSALSPPFEVIIAADVIHPQNAAALDPLLSSVRTLVGGGGSRYPFVLLSYVERSDKLTRALAAALSELPARCRRRPLGRHAWVYELDMWDNWPSGREWPPFELETDPATVGGRLSSRVPCRCQKAAPRRVPPASQLGLWLGSKPGRIGSFRDSGGLSID